MHYLFLSFLLLVPSCTGYGYALLYLFNYFSNGLFKTKSKLDFSFGELGILGFSFITFLATTLNLFLALSEKINAVILFFGLLFFFIYLKTDKKNSDKNYLSIFFNSALFILLPMGAFLSGMKQYIEKTAYHNWNDYDTGLYHLQNIFWIHQYPTPFGLGHINGAFAFNSIWFNTAASFWLPFLKLHSVFLINSLLFFFGCVFLCERTLKFFKNIQNIKLNSIDHFSELFAFIFLIFCLGFSHIFVHSTFYLFGKISSPTTDMPAALLSLLVIYLSLKLGLSKNLDSKNENKTLLLLSILTPLAIAIKVSSITIVLYPLIAILFQVFYSKNRVVLTKTINLLLITIIFLSPWILKGFFISGCGLYPVASTCFSGFPWSFSIENVISHKNALHFYALIDWTSEDPNAMELKKNLSYLSSDWRWLPGWIQWYSSYPLFIRSISVFFTSLILFFHLRLIQQFYKDKSLLKSFFIFLLIFNLLLSISYSHLPENFKLILKYTLPLTLIYNVYLIIKHKTYFTLMNTDNFKIFIFFIVSLICLSFWFLNAPIPRYGIAAILTLPFLMATFSIYLTEIYLIKSNLLKYTLLPLIFLFSIKIAVYTKEFELKYWFDQWPRIPEIEYVQYKSKNGVTLFKPPNFDQCWNSSIPCTPHEMNNLIIERSGNRFFIHKEDN